MQVDKTGGYENPILTDDTKLIDSDESKRIHRLWAIIKQIEIQHIGGTSATNKQKQELAELVEQQKKNVEYRCIAPLPRDTDGFVLPVMIRPIR